MDRHQVRPFVFSYTPAPYLSGEIIPIVPLFEPTQGTTFLGISDTSSRTALRCMEAYEGVPEFLPDNPVPEASENRGFTRQQWTRGAFFVGQVGLTFIVFRNAHTHGVFRASLQLAETSVRHETRITYTAFTAFVTIPVAFGSLIKNFYPAELTPRSRFPHVGDFCMDCIVYTALGYVCIRWYGHSQAIREWIYPNPAFWESRFVPLLLLGLTKEVVVSRTRIFADRPYEGMLEPLNGLARDLSGLVWRFIEYL